MSLINKQVCSPVVINFSSDNRSSGTNSNFFSASADLGINDYNTVCVVQASIPRSFYNVPNGRNTFIVEENSIQRTITMTPGSYNKTNLQSNLQTKLNNGAPPGWSYTVSYPDSTQPQTFKYTFTVTGNSGIQPKFIFTNSLYHQLGFEPNTTNNFSTNSLISTNVIDLSFISQVYISSNLIINSNDGILQEILNYGSFPMGSFCNFQQLDFEMNSRDFNKNITNSWQFVLTNNDGLEIDLNGIPWSFSLCFYCRNDTSELLRNDLKLKNEERIMKIEEEMNNLETSTSNPITTETLQSNASSLFNLPILPYYTSSYLSFLNQPEYIGPTGATGATGPTDATGPTGPISPTGPKEAKIKKKNLKKK